MRDDRLLVLAAGGLRGAEPELRPALERAGVAEPRRDLRRDQERLEADLRRLVGEHLQRLRDEPLRAERVGALVEDGVGERGERAALELRLAGRGGRLRDLLHLDDHGRHVREPPRGAPGEVPALERRRELDRAQQELARAAEGLARQRAPARARERVRGLLGELRRSGAVELLEQAGRLVEMERADLEQLVAGALAEPLRERVVQVGARGLREPAVRDLADEHVLELERVLAADRRARLAHDEIARDELLERALDVVHVRRQMLERAAHEEPAHGGSALDQRALRRRQPVDARRDERLERVGDPLGAGARPLRQHADRLLDEERVPLGLREHGRGVHRQLELRR